MCSWDAAAAAAVYIFSFHFVPLEREGAEGTTGRVSTGREWVFAGEGASEPHFGLTSLKVLEEHTRAKLLYCLTARAGLEKGHHAPLWRLLYASAIGVTAIAATASATKPAHAQLCNEQCIGLCFFCSLENRIGFVALSCWADIQLSTASIMQLSWWHKTCKPKKLWTLRLSKTYLSLLKTVKIRIIEKLFQILKIVKSRKIISIIQNLCFCSILVIFLNSDEQIELNYLFLRQYKIWTLYFYKSVLYKVPNFLARSLFKAWLFFSHKAIHKKWKPIESILGSLYGCCCCSQLAAFLASKLARPKYYKRARFLLEEARLYSTHVYCV